MVESSNENRDSSVASRLVIKRPDDFHLHLRDGAMLRFVLPHTSSVFARAIIMPNLKPPVRTAEDAIRYRKEILAALPDGDTFEPLMTLYLTDRTTAAQITEAKLSGAIHAVKYYPAGATTNSDNGVTDISKVKDALRELEQLCVPLLIHGEVTDPSTDIFDRESLFIEQTLIPLIEEFPNLRIVMEHLTTAKAARFIETAPPHVAATVTPHHLLMNRNHILSGGIKPHHYCLPILKREEDRKELLRVVTSGSAKFFAGTDSAPHHKSNKECVCGAAGIYNAPIALLLYAEVFESVNALDKLESFVSHHGADFYKLPRNHETITLVKKSRSITNCYHLEQEELVPYYAGQNTTWSIEQ